MNERIQLRAASIARNTDMVPAIIVSRLATSETIAPARLDSAEFVAISVHSLPGHGHGPLGAAVEARGRSVVATSLGQKRQCQKCLVMHRFKVDRFVETVLRTPAVAGRLANHTHQVVGRG